MMLKIIKPFAVYLSNTKKTIRLLKSEVY
jgi:hypothetical protein